MVLQLLCILDDQTAQLDQGCQVDVIYTDFENHLTKFHTDDYRVLVSGILFKMHLSLSPQYPSGFGHHRALAWEVAL